MTIVKEYRIRNNCTVDEYRIAQLYAVAKMSMNETGGGEGVEVLKNEPYDNEMGKGQYTYKIYHLGSRIPALLRPLIPKDALILHEEAWNGYPHCKTVVTSPYMKENMRVVTETMHLADRGTTENALNLSLDQLAQRQVEYIDVADNSTISKAAYKPSEDPFTYKSKKTGRGPLNKSGWEKDCEPVMTCYKVVTGEFKWWGITSTVEPLIQSNMRNVFTMFHRQLFCDTDEWYGMTIEDVRALEEETAKKLVEKRQQEGSSKTDFN
ncbi:phosphatidylinositol transfer protein beta isoform [Kickxella alabastrina]|uniref:phosphatidylinositol transfer protein beta isoform n=1 Tax=Kickxella alabastrina TaxID=61397 RepID=UPI00222078A9|nr:phosphatidylinositol transfer protein beta isoform [Kickxella alabastrina]KAI7820609.1 phosphatidylinositol transfer protein beta isoform [Kickxella alabastrina]KAJ1935477.1 hypothetical protein GGF37_005981 [Kickxella alabastrina]